MIRKVLGAGIVIAIIFVTSLVFAGPNMHPGLWEITTKIEIPGMPMKMPPTKTTQCLTRDNLVPRQSQLGGNQSCEVTNTEFKGDTVVWDMKCTGEEAAEAHGEITYHGDSFEGFIKMNMNVSGEGKKQMTLYLNGKRIGDCE